MKTTVPATITIPSGTCVVGEELQSKRASGAAKIATGGAYTFRALPQNIFQNDGFIGHKRGSQLQGPEVKL